MARAVTDTRLTGVIVLHDTSRSTPSAEAFVRRVGAATPSRASAIRHGATPRAAR